MKETAFIILTFMLISNMVSGQVVINEDSQITLAMESYKEKALSESSIDGWRIQIINTDDRRKMESTRSKFASNYPNLKMTWKHVQPYYQVRVGAYKTKLDLEQFLRELKPYFPSAIPIRDKINKSELIN